MSGIPLSTVNAITSDVASVVQELTAGWGMDAVVDTTGNNQVRQQAYEITSNTGTTVFAGVPSLGDKINIDSFPIHFGRRLVGSHGGETRPDVDIPRYLQLYKLGKLKLQEQITHRFPLDDINQAVDVLKRGDAGRCVVDMESIQSATRVLKAIDERTD